MSDDQPQPPNLDDGVGDMDIDDDTDMDDLDDIFHMADDEMGDEPLPPPPPPMPVPVVGPHRIHSMTEYRMQERSLRFFREYRVLSVLYLESQGHHDLESGGKVILPPSALNFLSRTSSALLSPMLFKATNTANNKSTHCGVLEFISEENTCYMPSWMMQNLGLNDHEMFSIERVKLPVATYAKFQPQSVDFLEISNPKAILENSLRLYACLTKGDMIAIPYNSRVYTLCVLETKPSDAVNIIECDMNVDFAPPIGYVSPSSSQEDVAQVTSQAEVNRFTPFVGSGHRLNGKGVQITPSKAVATGGRGQPDREWKVGGLKFTRKVRAVQPSSEGDKRFVPFGGAGTTLSKRKKEDD